MISTEGKFTLYVTSPVYRSYCIEADDGYIRNTKTGENCGQMVNLKAYYYDGATKLDKPIYEEDCYEFVFNNNKVHKRV